MKLNLKSLIMGLLLLLATQVLFSACSSDDDPTLNVGYYLATDAEEFIGISEFDEQYGTLVPPENHSIFMTILKMKKALRKEFATPQLEGNDARVISICDSCYQESIYFGSHGSTICTVRLMRTLLDGDRVVKSRQLKFYRFNKAGAL